MGLKIREALGSIAAHSGTVFVVKLWPPVTL